MLKRLAEQPRPAVARELGVELVEHRADLRFGLRLDDRGAGRVVGPALGIEVEDERRLQRVRAARRATCTRARARACRTAAAGRPRACMSARCMQIAAVS